MKIQSFGFHHKKYSFFVLLNIFLSSMLVLYQFLLQSSISIMIPNLLQDLKISLEEIGILSSSFFYTYILFQIPSGMLVDKYGPRIVLFISSFFLSISTLVFAYAESLTMAITARMLMGIASAPAIPCAMYIGATLLPKYFVMIAAFVEMMAMAGGIICDLIFFEVVLTHGNQLASYFCAIIGIILSLLIFIFIKKTPPIRSIQTSEPTTQKQYSIMSYFKNLLIWRYALYAAFMCSIIMAFASLWAIPFLETLYPEQNEWVAQAVSLIYIGAAIGTMTISLFATYFSRSIKKIMTICALFACTALFCIFFVPLPKSFIMIILFFLGLSSGAYALAFDCVKNLVHPSKKGLSMALTNMIIILVGAAIFQPLIGWLLDLQNHTNDNIFGSTQAFQIAFLPLFFSLLLTPLLIINFRRLR